MWLLSRQAPLYCAECTLEFLQGVQWLKTPTRNDIKEGKAKLVATAMRRRGELLPPPEEAPEKAPEEAPEEAAEQASEVSDGFVEPSDDEASGAQPAARSAAPGAAGAPRGKRVRSAPVRLDTETPSVKKGVSDG